MTKSYCFSQKEKRVIASLLTALVLWSSYSVVSFAAGAERIRKDVVRLHIIANSDSDDDQKIKLAVRDEILKKYSGSLAENSSKKEAEEFFSSKIDGMRKTADRLLSENGFSYSSKAVICTEYYPTRMYGEKTFPAGRYSSVKIILGNGDGHNWWCVMFPALCVPAASEKEDFFSERDNEIIEGGKKYKIAFKIVELYEKAVSKFDNIHHCK